MYNYKIDDGVTKKVLNSYNSNSKKSSIDDLIDKLNVANESFTTMEIPEYVAPDFEKMEKLEISQDDVKKQAESSLVEFKNNSLKQIDDNIDSKSNQLNSNRETLINNNEETKKKIDLYYDNARQQTSDDALKRGLARSSIVINQLDAFNKDELKTFEALEKDFNNNLNAIDFEINSLTKQKEQALADFDIAYAVKLNDAINNLNTELSKKQAEIIKYNNDIAEKEKEYLNNYNKLVNDIKNKNIDKDVKMIDLTAEYGEKVVSNYRKNILNNIVNSYFAGMDKNEVLSILQNNDDLKSALGSYYQDILDKYRS